MNRQMRDELTVQLILMGISLLLSAAVYWLILMPQWKRRHLMLRAKAMAEAGQEKARELTGKEMMLLREFAARVSEWDHEQAAKYRRARKEDKDASEGHERMAPCDNSEESD